jgi:ribosomal protein L11 methyltransferase
MSETYYILRLTEVSHLAEEWLSESAFAYGAMGTSEVLSFDQPEGEEDVFTRIADQRVVDVYFADEPSDEFMNEVRARFPEVRVLLHSEQNRDWMAEWKKSFQPFSLVGAHWVVPSWCEPPALAQHKIWIDPGMAFGTGTHETTQLVAEALTNLPKQVPMNSVLDVGTGTGILAILAHQLGAKRIAATEIEPEARRVALENFQRNECKHIQMDERQLQDLEESFDVVVANIIDGVLVRVQEPLLQRVRPGGYLIVSGIISERETDFLSGFRLPPGVQWQSRVQKGDWLAFVAKV